jgi:NitT/TauT family transport system permease protein
LKSSDTTPKTATRGRTDVLSFTRSLSNTTIFLLGTAAWALFFATWYYVVYIGAVPAILLPAPDSIIRSSLAMFSSEGFAGDVWASVIRIFLSFLLTSLVAIPLGIAMGSLKVFEAFFNPFVSAWRYLPAAAFVPILLMWLGTGETPKLALLILGVIFFQVTVVMDMTKSIPTPLLETAMTLGATRWQILARVIVPWMLPNIVNALRQTIAIGWTYLVIAEIIASTNGIGAVMMRAQRFVHTDKIMVGIVTIGVLGLLTDLGFQWLYRALFPHLGISKS